MNAIRSPRSWTTCLAAVLVLGSALLSGCAKPTPTNGGGQSVTMQAIQFHPQDLTVKVGDKVTWTNKDSEGHTVTSNNESGPLRSETLFSGQTYSYTFTQAGTYAYHCIPHASKSGDSYAGMVGKIIVQA